MFGGWGETEASVPPPLAPKGGLGGGWRIPWRGPWVEGDTSRWRRIGEPQGWQRLTRHGQKWTLFDPSTLIQSYNDLLPTPPLFSSGWGRVVGGGSAEHRLSWAKLSLAYKVNGQSFSCWGPRGCTLYVQPNTSLLSAVLHSINHLTCTQQMWFRSRIGVDHRTSNIICNGNLCNCIIV